jgi:hypothetical protein
MAYIPLITPIVAFALLSCAALAAAVFSVIALLLVRKQLRADRSQAESLQAAHKQEWQSRLDDVERRIETVATDLRDFEGHLPGGRPACASISPGLNLSKRAQALRMHRRGDPPGQIASVLDLPVQEVELLLKVQRIVLSNI